MKRLLLIWALYSLIFCWTSAVVSSCFPHSTCSSWRGQRGVTVLSQQVSVLLPKPQGERKCQAGMSHPNRDIWYSRRHRKCCWVILPHDEDVFFLSFYNGKTSLLCCCCIKALYESKCETNGRKMGIFTALGGFNTRLKVAWSKFDLNKFSFQCD